MHWICLANLELVDLYKDGNVDAHCVTADWAFDSYKGIRISLAFAKMVFCYLHQNWDKSVIKVKAEKQQLRLD